MIEQKDSELVKQSLKGDKKAFEILVERYQIQIFNVALRMTNNYADSEDITQSVFIKAYEKLNMYRPRYKFFSWIYRIAINETLNYLNQQKRIQNLNQNIISKQKTPEESYENIELNEKIQDALMSIGTQYQILIILKHFQNFSYKEITYILDLPEKKVKSRLYTARRLLRDALAEKGILSG